jgi:alkylation response protein AidB-like acyl-CoA dehydrogenase
MDLALTAEQRQLQRSVRDLLDTMCTKQWLDDAEESQAYPFDLYRLFAELGLFGVGVPEEFGGYGGGYLELSLIAEQLGHVGGSVVFTWFPTAIFGNQAVLAAGDAELKRRVLPAMAAGELRTAFALTEPQAGSDAAAIRTRARSDRGSWVIDGTKTWSSGALAADFLIVAARTGDEGTHAALTLFLVDARSAGLTIRAIPKLGHNAVASCEIGLSDVRVPGNAVIGTVGGAWTGLKRALDAERLGVGAVCTGLAQQCIDLALDYGMSREQFGQPVATFQALSHMLADMETETAAARLLSRAAAWRADAGLPFSKEASMAKAYAAECGTRTATRAMQIFGGYSYSSEYPIERFYREAKLYEVAGGSTQIQRNIIAREMGIR